MQITHTEIYGLDRAKESAGLPKMKGEEPSIPDCINKLGRAPIGSGHDCFLKGIIVQCRIKADHSFWMQWMRYHFQDIVSSSSKMHSILNGKVDFEEGTDLAMIVLWGDIRQDCIENPTQDNFHRLIMSAPIGMLLTADVTTNYLQLKTIHNQRSNHKMRSWHTLCDWIEELPEFNELTKGK